MGFAFPSDAHCAAQFSWKCRNIQVMLSGVTTSSCLGRRGDRAVVIHLLPPLGWWYKWYCYTDKVQTPPVLFSTSTAQITLSFFTPSLTFSFFTPSLFFLPGLHWFICFLLLLIVGNVAPQRFSQGLVCSSPCPFTRRFLTTSASQTHFAISLYLAAN